MLSVCLDLGVREPRSDLSLDMDVAPSGNSIILLDLSFPGCKMGIGIPSSESHCGAEEKGVLGKLMDLLVLSRSLGSAAVTGEAGDGALFNDTNVSPKAGSTFLSLCPWGPRFAVRAWCTGDARDAGDGRVSSTAALGPGGTRQTQEQQQHQNAAPRGRHHRPVSATACGGDEKMEWVIARETCTTCAIIHSPLHALTGCVLPPSQILCWVLG